jgi:hypothetical protein
MEPEEEEEQEEEEAAEAVVVAAAVVDVQGMCCPVSSRVRWCRCSARLSLAEAVEEQAEAVAHGYGAAVPSTPQQRRRGDG